MDFGRQAFGQTLVPLWSESQRQSRSAMESPCPDGIPFYWEESVPKNNHACLMKTSMVVCVCVGIATLDCLPHPMPIEDFPAELRTRQLSRAQLSRFPFQSLAITRVSLIVLFHHPVGTSANASDYQTSGGFFSSHGDVVA